MAILNSSHPLNLVAALLVLALAPVVLLLGVAGVVSDSGPVRPWLALLAACGAAMLYAGVQMLLRWRRGVAREASHQIAIRSVIDRLPARGDASGSHRTTAAGEPVLAHWTYSADEWSAHSGTEWRRQRVRGVAMGAGILLLGLVVGRGESRGEAVAASAVMAVLVVGGHLLLARSAHRSGGAGGREAIIMPTAVLLNGHYHSLAGDTYHLREVRYDTDAHPPALEFTIGWQTRGGPTEHRLRVPVPLDREGEARDVVARLAENGRKRRRSGGPP